MILFTVALVSIVYYFYSSISNKKNLKNTVSQVKVKTNAVREEIKENMADKISQVAFYQLTIPYLQEREYKSNLGELQKYQTNSNYASYITSYNSDGYKINGLLTIPSGAEPENGWPAIVFIHGYIPPTQYRTTEKYVAYVDYLARNGYVVFKIDLRGHGQSEGEAGGAYYSSEYIIDTLNAVSALQNSDFVNSKTIGLWGHSMGGNVVFRSMVSSTNVKAGVIWAGAVYTYQDFLDYGISDSSYQRPSDSSGRTRRRQELFDAHGDLAVNSPFWSTIIPTNYLDSLNAPLQLNHAVNDNVVDIEYSRNLAQILEGSNKVVELNEYQSGGHNIENPSFTTAMQNTVRFFDDYLKK